MRSRLRIAAVGAVVLASACASSTPIAPAAPTARKEIPVANAAGLAVISPATSNPCLTRNLFMPAPLNPTHIEIDCKAAGLPSAADLRPAHTNDFFRLTTTDELQGAAAADYMVKDLHLLR